MSQTLEQSLEPSRPWKNGVVINVIAVEGGVEKGEEWEHGLSAKFPDLNMRHPPGRRPRSPTDSTLFGLPSQQFQSCGSLLFGELYPSEDLVKAVDTLLQTAQMHGLSAQICV